MNMYGHLSQVSAPPLPDDQKRWLVVGICLHSIVTPALREHIPQTIQGLYASLKHSDNIDKQTFAHYLRRYKPTNKELNYESINNNANIPKIRGKKDIQNYNYMVKDEVDLSKLFLTTHMTHFTAFGDTCDSSALLSIIINVDKFDHALRAAATAIRDEVRNPWAHCRVSDWDKPKLQMSFTLMKHIIKCLRLPLQDEALLLQKLNTWNTSALQILHGNIGYELLKSFTTEISLLARYCRMIKSGADENFTEVLEALNSIGFCSGKLELRLRELEIENMRTKKDTANCTATLNTFIKRFERTQRKADSLTSTQEEASRKKYYFSSPPRIKYFVGRKRELKRLKDNFFNTNRRSYTQAICGLGGVGKTSLANEYSWEYREQYPGGVYWVLAEAKSCLLESFIRLSARVGIERDSLESAMTNTLHWLSSRQERWLLVIDNLDSEQLDLAILELLFGDWRHDTRGHILITTRREGLSAVEVLSVESFIGLHDLSVTEALIFMKERTGCNTDDFDDTIQSLVDELHGLPLALEQAAAHIKILKCSFEEYLDSFRQKHLGLLIAVENNSIYERSPERFAVETTWNMNFEYIERCSLKEGLGTAAVTVMEIFALLPHIRILPDVLNFRYFDFDEELRVLNDNLNKNRIIEILGRFSIVNREDRDALIMHRLVKQAVEENISTDRKYTLLLAVNAAVNTEVFDTLKKPQSAPSDVLLECPTTETKIASLKRKLGLLYCQLVAEYELKKKYELLFKIRPEK